MVGRAFIAAAAIAGLAAAQSDPSYDHQTTTYNSQFAPVNTHGVVNVTAFFSPEHSTDTEVALIQSVGPGGTIDIASPGFSTWQEQYNCTYGPEGGCIGCTVQQMASETFPIFGAVLNAIHQQGATVRFLVNDYGQPTCPGMISPFDYWALNGVNVSFYTSTTFVHAKYMRVTGPGKSARTMVSSINYSNSSFLQNREAGVVIDESTAAGAALAAVSSAAFNYDHSTGNVYTPPNTYSPAEMAIITSTAPYALTIPSPRIAGAFITPDPYPVTVRLASLSYASPDSARDTLMADISSATTSLELYTYQITDSGIANALVDLYNAGVNVTIMVSAYIYDETDWKLAQTCYTTLYNAGLTIRRAPKYYAFSHNKFYIIDGKRVSVSTGNWSPSDYPTGSSFPPFGQSGWQDVNRDFTVSFASLGLVQQFRNVMYGDWPAGSWWQPYAE